MQVQNPHANYYKLPRNRVCRRRTPIRIFLSRASIVRRIVRQSPSRRRTKRDPGESQEYRTSRQGKSRWPGMVGGLADVPRFDATGSIGPYNANIRYFPLTSITMRPTGLSSAVISKKTRGSAMFFAAEANSRASVTKDGRLGRAVATKWLDRPKVESIDNRQIDLNAIPRFWKLAGNRDPAWPHTPRASAFLSLPRATPIFEISRSDFSPVISPKNIM